MRKNKMMRTAAVLGVAAMLTASVLSGTFAKYVTTGTGTDEARVAKFGVTITAHGTMFADTYTKDDKTVETITNSVVSATTTGEGDAAKKDNVVAPGTSGTLANATITGTPEVAVNVKYEPTLTITGWEYKTNETSETTEEYFPIVFTVNGTTYGLTGMKDSKGTKVTNESVSIDALKTAVQTAIASYSKNYAPNTDLSKIDDNTDKGYVHVSWEWAFDQNDDTKDTYLGDQAADGNASTIKLEIKTTVTQID